ncbi:hypothetical protein GWK47_047528 [Chionoecetes opilio]|uniref:Uncharacterized protein n=1 Tax=Chionoecetes opilio TaxID=41210 RepID=A0A8J4Y3L0_CHIOP|nr:hypothetical protein GWK47_047528 [Chionoecetes opilio]
MEATSSTVQSASVVEEYSEDSATEESSLCDQEETSAAAVKPQAKILSSDFVDTARSDGHFQNVLQVVEEDRKSATNLRKLLKRSNTDALEFLVEESHLDTDLRTSNSQVFKSPSHIQTAAGATHQSASHLTSIQPLFKLPVVLLLNHDKVDAVISRLLFEVTEQAVLDISEGSSPDEDEEDDFFKALTSPGPTATEGTNSTRPSNKMGKEFERWCSEKQRNKLLE